MPDFRDNHVMRSFRQPPAPAPDSTMGQGEEPMHGSPLAQAFGNYPATNPAAGSPVGEDATHNVPAMSDGFTGGEEAGEPAFTVVEISDNGYGFAGEWRPTMATPEYIGNNAVLLRYLYDQERKHKVTMPIKACGIDPIVFTYADTLLGGDEGDDVPKLYTVPGVEPDAAGQPVAYELIRVDGSLYMSCVSQCLDEEYLTSVLAEATTAIKETGEYIYQLVNYRKLVLEAGQSECQLLHTLRLNTFEMSVLVTYMKSFENMSVAYKTIGGKQCIVFSVK